MLAAFGSIAAALASLAAAYAVVQARRTERKSADRETTQQAIDTIEKLNVMLEAKVDRLESANHALGGRLDEMRAAHMGCESRLRIAEAKIAELGG